MVRREDDGVWVTLKETIAAQHDDVFACFTTADGLSRWFPLAAQVELPSESGPGGQIVFSWDADFKKTSTLAILDYDAGGRIVWDWYASYEDTHAPVYWTVTPQVEQGSKVILRQGPFKEEPDLLIAMAEEAESWRWYLCNLRGVLEMKHDMRSNRPL
jgi:uncharacterized protein YndB with AHSA1/START domain